MQLRTPLPNRKASAFTLIEMIGVLAVIAILAALLIPKVFEAINNARINSATVSYNTVKTALTDHYAKFGSILTTTSGPLTVPQAAYDTVLLAEGFLDKPFETRIGTSASIEAVAGVAPTAAVTGVNSAYDLDGSGATANDVGPATATVVQAKIVGVSMSDAKDLNDRLDGVNLGAADLVTADLEGRVKYALPIDPATTTTVYIYVTHR